MHSFNLLAFALLAIPVFGAPSKIQIQRIGGPKRQNSYIVKLKEGTNKEQTLSWLQSHLGSNSTVSYDYDSRFFNAFAGKFCSETLAALTANKDVEYITEDRIHTIQASATQTDAPWGLQRISQPNKLNNTDPRSLDFQYTYDDRAGEGVDVYVLDTGIYTAHKGFEGRATWGYSAIEGASADGHGHGTHCAGTIASTPYGVAKKSNVIAVKVLSDDGSGSTSEIVSGIDWVIAQHKSSGRPSVISMSLGGEADTILDKGVASAVYAGIHVVVAAGNSNTDAGNTSPARVTPVITVGATNITDTRASFSNYGAVVDVFAPGQNIISTWIGSPEATNSISGTSMATPHVAGAVAYMLSTMGQKNPAQMQALLKTLCVPVVRGAPSGTTNCLLQLPKVDQ